MSDHMTHQTKPHHEQAVGYRIMSKTARQSETECMMSFFFTSEDVLICHTIEKYILRKINFRLHTQSNN